MRYVDLDHLNSARHRERPRRNFTKVLKRAGLVLVALVFFAVGYWSYFGYQAVVFLFSSTGQSIASRITLFQSQTGSGQENYLLLGSDNDQKFTGNPLTQTMLVVHLDRSANTVTLLSIPRDLWVRIPATGKFGKIDESAGYGGIPDAVKVVEQNFGIPINHYAWVGLYGFVKGIDDFGGVNLDVLHPVLDNAYPSDVADPNNPYGLIRLDLPAGLQHLDGATALEYVRARHEDQLGDFARTQRQRQLLLTLKDELLSGTLLTEAPQALADLQGQLKTDMTPVDLAGVGHYFLNNSSVTVNQLSLGTPATHNASSIGGQSIIVADPQAVAAIIGQIFGSNAETTTFNSLVNPEGVHP